jgi:purine-binding chemotaxis protein CheW
MVSANENVATAQTDARAGKYLTFQLANEAFGIRVLKVRESMGLQEITAVPQTPAHIKGVINLRGKVVPVIDLRLKFGLEKKEDTDRTCIIVVRLSLDGSRPGAAEVTLGVIVDEVSEVVNVPAEAIEPPPAFGSSVDVSFLLGVGKLGNKVVMLLDADRILPREELQTVAQEAAVAA